MPAYFDHDTTCPFRYDLAPRVGCLWCEQGDPDGCSRFLPVAA